MTPGERTALAVLEKLVDLVDMVAILEARVTALETAVAFLLKKVSAGNDT